MCIRNDTIDKHSWRCHKRKLAHDVKINIRLGTIFENFEIKIYKTVKEIKNKKSDKIFLKCINYKK